MKISIILLAAALFAAEPIAKSPGVSVADLLKFENYELAYQNAQQSRQIAEQAIVFAQQAAEKAKAGYDALLAERCKDAGIVGECMLDAAAKVVKAKPAPEKK